MNKRRVERAFSAAANGYDGLADLQREVGNRLFSRLETRVLKPSKIIDIGAGTGFCTEKLAGFNPDGSVVALDIAEGMLEQAKNRLSRFPNVGYCQADAEQLPFQPASVDLLFSNLALQWCRCDGEMFSHFSAILAEEGQVVFSSFGPQTLSELRESWSRVDDEPHVNNFLEADCLLNAMQAAGLRDCEVRSESVKRYYANVFELMRELKGIGAKTVNGAQREGLTGKGKMAEMISHYEQSREKEGIPATWEVIYGFARK